ncbi:MAG: transcription elongation factor GreA, partial [Lutibacter sp.]|nr:transcription elongation factor GreA [Lutibacter sp.]
MSTVSYYSEEGLKKLKDELDHLEHVERPRVSNAIAEARDKGDLSENAEYVAAKEHQKVLFRRVEELQTQLSRTRTIDLENVHTERINVGTRFEAE